MGEETNITIELMKKEDMDGVLAIEQASFSQPWSRNLFLSEFRNRSVSTLLSAVMHESGVRGVAGYIVFWNVEDEMHILNLAVTEPLRRRGIARLLVLSAVRRAAAKGAKRGFLEVRASNTPARKLYSRLGFTGAFVRRNYYDAPIEDAIVMTLEEGAFARLAAEPK